LLLEGKNACLLGQIVLGEVLACPSSKKLTALNFCLLDVSDTERIKRLRKRNTYRVDQSTLNWAAWLRMHHHEPQWMQHVIKEHSWEGLNFSLWDKLTEWNSVAHTKILTTTYLSIEEVS